MSGGGKKPTPKWVSDTLANKQVSAERRELALLRRKLDETTRASKALERDMQLLYDQVELALAVSTLSEVPPIQLPKGRSKQRPGTVVALASDWHVGEHVDPATVQGLNHLTPAIARKRMRDYFVGLDWYIRRQRVAGDVELGYQIDTLVLAFLGDMVGGYIHRELAETNILAPLEEIELAYEGIISGIDYLLATSGLRKIQILGVGGNHDRTSDKVQHANFAKLSLATFLYKQIARHYAADKRVEFVIAEGAMLYSEIYDVRFRWFHGHTITGGGGIGGIMVPFRRWHMTQQATKDVDCTCIGHFHQLQDNGWGVVNGSLKGFDAFAANKGFPYERPRQAVFLVDPENGKREVTPINLGPDMRKREVLARRAGG